MCGIHIERDSWINLKIRRILTQKPLYQFFINSPGISMWVFKSQKNTSAAASTGGREGPMLRVFSSFCSREKESHTM